MALREQSGLGNKVLSEAFAMRRLLHGQGLHGCQGVLLENTVCAAMCAACGTAIPHTPQTRVLADIISGLTC